MDIILRGTIPEEKQYVATCSNCSTKVSYKLKEVNVTVSQREGALHEYSCPVCGKKVNAIPRPMIDPYKDIYRSRADMVNDYYNK